MILFYEVDEEAEVEIKTMMEQTGIKTKRDFFNNAITLFEWAIKEQKKGRTLCTIDDNSVIRHLVLNSLNNL